MKSMYEQSPSSALTVMDLTVLYRDEPALLKIYAHIPRGSFAAIAGPNGAGKTTLLKALLGLVKPCAGEITLLDDSPDRVRDRVAYVPQRTSVDWDFPISARDVVLMGCYRRLGWFSRPRKADYQRADELLALVEMDTYADRHIAELSGGQQQRIFLARALMQDADLYLMDEPFNGIDIKTEQTMIAILKNLCAQGKTVVAVHHDLHTLSTYFDWLLLLNTQVIANGPLERVMTAEHINITYGRTIYVPPTRERQ